MTEITQLIKHLIAEQNELPLAQIAELRKYQKGFKFGPHRHVNLEINLVKKGSCKMRFDDEVVSFHANDCMVISVEMFDAKTLNLVAPVAIVKNSLGGAYLTFAYNKSVKFRINMVRGDNAVLSGIFFDSNTSGLKQTFEKQASPQAPFRFEKIHLTSSLAEFSFNVGSSKKNIDATLFDTQGHKVAMPLSGTYAGEQQIAGPLPNLIPGIYILQVKTDGKIALNKKIFIDK